MLRYCELPSRRCAPSAVPPAYVPARPVLGRRRRHDSNARYRLERAKTGLRSMIGMTRRNPQTVPELLKNKGNSS
jgi:hypothetical protein